MNKQKRFVWLVTFDLRSATAFGLMPAAKGMQWLTLATGLLEEEIPERPDAAAEFTAWARAQGRYVTADLEVLRRGAPEWFPTWLVDAMQPLLSSPSAR